MTKELQSAMSDIKNISEKLSASSQQKQTLYNLKTSTAKIDEDLEGLKHSF